MRYGTPDPMYGHPGKRRTGAGYNHPLVLGGRMQHDWREHYAFMRGCVRFHERRRRRRSPPSVIEAMRRYRKNG